MRLRFPAFGPAHMVLAVAFLLLGLFLYATVQTAMQEYRLRTARGELMAEVATLKQQRAELDGLLAYMESDEYIEAAARRQFGLVRPGETVIDVQSPERAEPERAPGARWWESIFTSASP